MTMHVVLGDGEMTRKELTETMADLWKADEEAGATFWFLVQGKSEPTTTDTALVKWLEQNDIYYEVITDDADSVAAVYSQPQETHVAKKLSAKVVNLLNGKPEEGEEAELLALFYSDDSSAEEDRWLNQVCQDVFDAGFKVRALNDGLLEVDLSEDASKSEEEPPEEAAKVVPIKGGASKKAVAKKGGAAPRRDTQVSDEGETDGAAAASSTYTRDQLEEMDLDGLKAIAVEKGIELPSRTRMTTYIDKILGVDDTPDAEVTVGEADEIAGTNGFDVEALADAIVLNIIKRLEAALS